MMGQIKYAGYEYRPEGRWSRLQLARLRELWANGHSASRVAEDIGDDLTRDAVLGMVYRLKLPPRETMVSNPRGRPRGKRFAQEAMSRE